MKTQNKIWTALAIVSLASTVIFTSCKKKEEVAPDTEQNTATDNNMAESIVSDIESMGGEVSENSSLVSYKSSEATGITEEDGIAASPCATVSGLGTKIYTVDFGTTGCVGYDGRTRTGKLIYDFSASTPSSAAYYRNPGFSMSVSSQNYVVDGNQVNIISKTVKNTTPPSIPAGDQPGINLTWAIAANVSIVKPNSGGTISWSCSRTKELMNTNDTTCYRGQSLHIIWNKAIVKLNGTATGVNAKGENYTAVATDLIRDFNCAPDPLRPKRHPFISGTIAYTPGSRPLRLIDYGSASSCDMNATVTINGKVYNITLN
ncbi:MAG: hypothetical protein PSX36_15860 [bacterium]|nr:hypothetical protein [bacterium]